MNASELLVDTSSGLRPLDLAPLQVFDSPELTLEHPDLAVAILRTANGKLSQRDAVKLIVDSITNSITNRAGHLQLAVLDLRGLEVCEGWHLLLNKNGHNGDKVRSILQAHLAKLDDKELAYFLEFGIDPEDGSSFWHQYDSSTSQEEWDKLVATCADWAVGRPEYNKVLDKMRSRKLCEPIGQAGG